jgi:RNAse (barnase) inhibitor barstar
MNGKREDASLISFVSDRENDILWDSVTTHLTLPVGVDLRNLVKSWAVKKMATQF